MEITCRKYKDRSDYKRICEFLKETYLSYGTRFYDNITLFEFQCALSSGQQDGLKEVDEVLNETFLWFDGDKLIGKLTEDSFCIRGEYRQIFNDIVEMREKLCYYASQHPLLFTTMLCLLNGLAINSSPEATVAKW